MNLVEVKVDSKLGTIESNLSAVAESVKAYVNEYADYVVSEETVKDSKSLLADIRKQQKALDDERKSIKKTWNEPYNAFEKQAKEVIALYDEPINQINMQLLQFEEDRKAKKREEIREAYEECKGDLGEYLTYEKIYNPKWENASVSIKSVKEDMETQFAGVEMSISTIKSLNSKFEDKGIEVYKNTLDMQQAIQTMTRYQKQEEEILARQEAEKKAAEERARLEEERKAEEKRNAEAAALAYEMERARRDEEDRAKEIFPDVPPMDEEPFVADEEPFETDDEAPFTKEHLDLYVEVKVPYDKIFEFKKYLEDNGYDFEVEG